MAFVSVFLRLIAATALTAALAWGAFFGAMMVICTAGGALIIAGPVAVLAVPIYFKSMKALKRNMHVGSFLTGMVTMGALGWFLVMIIDQLSDRSYYLRYGREMPDLTLYYVGAAVFAVLTIVMLGVLARQYLTRQYDAPASKPILGTFGGGRFNIIEDKEAPDANGVAPDAAEKTPPVGVAKINQALVTYIENARGYGATDEVIRKNLSTEGGWSDGEIDVAFAVANWHQESQ